MLHSIAKILGENRNLDKTKNEPRESIITYSNTSILSLLLWINASGRKKPSPVNTDCNK